MADVTFNEEPSIGRTVVAPQKKAPLFASLVISMGLAKTAAEADGILVAIAIFGLVISVIVTVLSNLPPSLTVSKSALDTATAGIQAEQLQAQQSQ